MLLQSLEIRSPSTHADPHIITATVYSNKVHHITDNCIQFKIIDAFLYCSLWCWCQWATHSAFYYYTVVSNYLWWQFYMIDPFWLKCHLHAFHCYDGESWLLFYKIFLLSEMYFGVNQVKKSKSKVVSSSHLCPRSGYYFYIYLKHQFNI